jgi:hypothetical protein
MKLKKTNLSTTFESTATAEQKYDVVATVSYDAEGAVKSINGGFVRLGQKNVANFNRYSAEQLSVTYTSALSTEEKQEITAVIDEFVVAAEVAEKSNI